MLLRVDLSLAPRGALLRLSIRCASSSSNLGTVAALCGCSDAQAWPVKQSIVVGIGDEPRTARLKGEVVEGVELCEVAGLTIASSGRQCLVREDARREELYHSGEDRVEGRNWVCGARGIRPRRFRYLRCVVGLSRCCL